MSKPISFPRIDQEPEFFKNTIDFTNGKTGFGKLLIEKDYFCSLLLFHLYSMENCPLVFKGGTALNKIHAGFYRLSEDLDFSIPISMDATRTDRSRAISLMKEWMTKIPNELPDVTIASPLQGRNNSMQYNAEIHYRSVLDEPPGSIKIEIGLREPLLAKAETHTAQTLLFDPQKKTPLVHGFAVQVLSKTEAYAEKIRAALSRREPAIRDFFDLFHALKNAHIDFKDERLIQFAKEKLKVPGNKIVDLTDDRVSELRKQMEAELRPVLQEEAYNQFSLDEILSMLKSYQEKHFSDLNG